MKKILIFIMLLSALGTMGCSIQNGVNYNKEGKQYLKEEEYEKAAESYKQAIKSNPKKAEYYIDYGFSLVALEKYEEAHIQFNKAILNKDNKIVRENNKRAYRGKAIAYFNGSDYKKSIKEADKALKISELDDMDVDILYYKAYSHEIIGEYEDAYNTYKIIQEKEKPNSKIYAAIAGVAYKIDKTKEAIEYYDKAIELDKTNYEYYIGKYVILNETEDVQGAEKVLEEALAIKTTNDKDEYNLAKLYFYKGDFDKAKEQLLQSSKKGFSEAEYYLGDIEFKNEDYKAAITHYENYLQNTKQIDLTTVYHQLSSALIQEKEFEKALEYVKKGLEYNDEAQMPFLRIAEITVYEHLGEFDTAYKKALEYVEKYPDNEEVKREVKFLKTRVGKKE